MLHQRYRSGAADRNRKLGLTAILRHHDEHRLAFSLAACDMSAMVGVLGGMALVGVLPKTWPWNLAFLDACVPQLVALPLSLLRIGTPARKLAWRTAQYRIAIDAGMFAGPFLCGVLGERYLWLLSASSAACLAALAVALVSYRVR